jgi:hypothetical protein
MPPNGKKQGRVAPDAGISQLLLLNSSALHVLSKSGILLRRKGGSSPLETSEPLLTADGFYRKKCRVYQLFYARRFQRGDFLMAMNTFVQRNMRVHVLLSYR